MRRYRVAVSASRSMEAPAETMGRSSKRIVGGRLTMICFCGALMAGLVGIDASATYGARVSADEPQYLLTALSLAQDHDLDISDEINEEAFRPFHQANLNQQTIELNQAGQRISPHDPLLPMVLAVPVGIAGWVGAKVALAVLAGMTAITTLHLAVRRFGVSPTRGAGVVLAFFVGSPLASYGAQVYPAMPAALLVVVGVAAVTGGHSRRKAVVAVVVVVALPWLSVKYVPMAAVLAGAFLGAHWHQQRRTAVALSTGVFALAGLVYLFIHQRIWGGWTVYASGDHFVDSEFLVVGSRPNYVARTNRLLGLLIDRYYGIAAWAPVYLFMPVGVLAMIQHRDRSPRTDPAARWWERHFDGLVILAVVAVAWAVATWVALTMHGWWWPGRQIVPILPLVVVAVAVFVQRFPRALWPVLGLGVIGGFNWIWMVVEASTGQRALIVDHEETANPLFQTWKQVLPDHRVDALGDQILTLVWAVILAGSIFLAWQATRQRPAESNEPRGPASA